MNHEEETYGVPSLADRQPPCIGVLRMILGGMGRTVGKCALPVYEPLQQPMENEALPTDISED